MDTVLMPLLQSPRLPDYIRELTDFFNAEQERRSEFYKTMRDDEKVEFINGEVVCHSPARLKRTLIIEYLGNILSRYVRKKKCGIVLREKALVRLTRNDFEPDICFFSTGKYSQFNNDTMFYPAPDFVIEVLSKTTEKIDRGIKKDDYALHGIQEYWIINPDKKELEQYSLADMQYELKAKMDNGQVRCVVLQGLAIPLAAIFEDDANELFLQTI